ncbi:hypothetical protein HAX54_049606 [Datura stramonium]|uniref:Uncharacterized protein n=1 Tax=Datura stramonium TaxID=4076 RepID=A0ABS8WKK9_DATST|nr:hypothetical protein [Datura stramonium]
MLHSVDMPMDVLILARDGAGTSRSTQVSKIPRVSELQARVEDYAYADKGAGNFDSDIPYDAYEPKEMGDSGDNHDDDLQPTDDVPQNTPFHGENVPFLYNLQDCPEVYASTRESNGVRCKVLVG